jgi:hypothetical protein
MIAVRVHTLSLVLLLQLIVNAVSSPSDSARAGERSPPASSKPNGAESDYQGPSREFQAPDKSFAMRVPLGWRSRTMMAGAQPLHVFEPEGTGEERILVSSGVAAADSIRDLAQQSMALAIQLFPALRPTGAPSFLQVAGEPAAEVSYTGMSAVGVPVSGWQGVILKDRFYFAVMGLARTDRSTPIQKEAGFMLRSMRPGHIEENRQLAGAIVGRWTFYQGSSSGGGSNRTSSSVSKQVTFYPNGRFEYQGAVYVDTNTPGGGGGTASGDKISTGTYKVYGNTLYSQIDGGGQAVFGLELVKGGGLKIDGTLFIRE